MIFRVISIILCLLICRTSSAGVPELDSVLAAVNGDPITLGEILPVVRAAEYKLRAMHSGKKLETAILLLRKKTVDEIIDRKLAAADFAEKKLLLPSQEVEKEIDRWSTFIGCHSRKELEQKLRESGTDMEALRKRIREQMMVMVMRRREFVMAGIPTPGEVYARFKKVEKSLSRPGAVELALLKVDKKAQTEIKIISAKLRKDPGAWDDLVLQYSIAPGKKNGGKVGEIGIDKLRPEFADAIKKPHSGNILGPLNTSDGVYFIKIISHKAPVKALFRNHAAAIRKQMEDEIYRKSAADYAARLRDRAVIEYFFPVSSGVDVK